MTLPTGQISMSQVNVELGLSSTAQISLNDSAVRSLAGVASGQISMDNLRGKSAGGTFSPDGGTSSGSPVALYDYKAGGASASVTITCSATATWTWTRSGTYGTASIASGGTGTSITFTLNNSTTTPRSTTWTVSATSGSTTRYWSVQLDNDGLA